MCLIFRFITIYSDSYMLQNHKSETHAYFFSFLTLLFYCDIWGICLPQVLLGPLLNTLSHFILKNVGCDLELLSGGTYDRCGICKGDGAGCELHTGRNDNPFTTPGDKTLRQLKNKLLINDQSYNLGQGVGDNFSKLSKTGFSM